MKITQLNKLCKSDKDVWDLGGNIGQTMFAAIEAANSGKAYDPADAAKANPKFAKTESEFNQDLYEVAFKRYAKHFKDSTKAKDVKPGTRKPTDLFGHF